ncbi:MAG: hypothetical protein JRN08_06925 [Nitrososphaerota archaeon]|nr:hypothetical protein [Nitrososphaerota archaeon]
MTATARPGRKPLACTIIAALIVLLVVPGFVRPAAAATTPTLDPGAVNSAVSSSTNPISTSITYTNTNDLVYVVVAVDPAGSSPSIGLPSASGLSFASRCAINGGTLGVYMASFYAVASSAASSGISISASFSGAVGATATMVAFAVTGEDTAAPFDPNLSSCPAGATGTTQTSGTITFSTTGTDDFVIGSAAIFGSALTGSIAVGSGFTSIASVGGVASQAGAEYLTTSTAGSQAPAYSFPGAAVAWAMIGDAFVTTGGASNVPDLPFGALPLVMAVPVVYAIARRRRALGP